MRKYVAVIEAFAVRDAQYCKTAETDPLSDDWEDLPDAEIYLGIFTGSYDECLEEAAEYGNTDPENVRLIDVDSDA